MRRIPLRLPRGPAAMMGVAFRSTCRRCSASLGVCIPQAGGYAHRPFHFLSSAPLHRPGRARSHAVSLLRPLARVRGDPPAASRALDAGSQPEGASLVPANHVDLIAEATAHALAGRLAQSLTLLSERLAAEPDSELLYARALTLFDWGRLRESLD